MENIPNVSHFQPWSLGTLGKPERAHQRGCLELFYVVVYKLTRQTYSPAEQATAANPSIKALSDAPGSGLFEAVSAEPKTTFQIHTQVWRGETTVQRTPAQNTVTAATATKEAGKAIMQTPRNPS